MSEPDVTRKDAATVTNLDAGVIQDIYQRIAANGNQVTIELRNAQNRLAIVFSDMGEVLLDVTNQMPTLEDVQKNDGIFLVYAPNPGMAMSNPPLPDMMCPCGGP